MKNRRALVRFQPGGLSLPYSSMVERRAVNAGVVGSSPTEAVKPCGVIGNTSEFGSDDSRFESWRGCQIMLANVCVRFQISPSAWLFMGVSPKGSGIGLLNRFV